MADLAPEFEYKDSSGSTAHYSGTAGTTAVAIPSVAGNFISYVHIENDVNNPTNPQKTLLFSFDGGTNYFEIQTSGGHFAWPVKGRKQIHVKGSTNSGGGVLYKILINFEEFS